MSNPGSLSLPRPSAPVEGSKMRTVIEQQMAAVAARMERLKRAVRR